MKIAFVGDSYCWHINKGSWPFIVAETFNAEIILAGASGQCFYHSFQDLLGVVDEADYIIFCVTGSGRIANYHRLPLNTGMIEDYYENKSCAKKYADTYKLPRVQLRQIMNAARDYYKNLVDFSYHRMAQHGMLMMVDELMIKQKKKCIWFSCYEDSMSNDYFNHFIPKSGPLGNIALYNISHNELIFQGMTDKEVRQATLYDTRKNHLNEENNKRLANLIIDTITLKQLSPGIIKMQNYFEVLK
tara:strand:+ start:282 stop:1016 length:735 start_codon:yes stop_codon:yes gene_type:complete